MMPSRPASPIVPPRLHLPPDPARPLSPGLSLALPETAARHVQVLRLQPDAPVLLFDGLGGQWTASIQTMTRRDVVVRLEALEAVERELPMRVTLAVCMPSNDRMDDLVEKATELGVDAIVPLMGSRSVLKLQGERASRKQAHWQAVAVAACEQSGRNRIPVVHPVMTLESFIDGTREGRLPASASREGLGEAAPIRWQLSLAADAPPLPTAFTAARVSAGAHFIILSGPEGGLTEAEQAAAAQAGWAPVSLGPRVLRADTAPLAALAALGTWAPQSAGLSAGLSAGHPAPQSARASGQAPAPATRCP